MSGYKDRGLLRHVLHRSQAFTLIELMIVILLIGILVGLAVPVFVSAQAMARRNVCWHDQRSIKYALMRWSAENPDGGFVTESCLPGGGEAYIDLKGNVPGDKDRSLAVFFDEGSNPFDCPSNGEGVGQVARSCDYITDGVTVACLTDNQIGIKADGTPFKHDKPQRVDWNHVHAGEEGGSEEQRTPLGNDFEEITSGMIDLIQDFYEKNGRYPRSWGDYVFTDIGLDPSDWKLPVDHIFYKPGGSRVKVTPEEGYGFTVKDLKGNEKKLLSKYNWSLWYDMKTESWYYHRIEPGNEIDINSLEVIEE